MEATPDDGPIDWVGAGLRPLAGGYSGETYVGRVGGDRAVVRIYARNPERAAIDASLLHLVRGLVPVPAVLELRHPTGATPALLITEYVEGTRLDLALAEPDHPLDLAALGQSLAGVLNALAGIPFLDFGMFAGPDLTLAKEEMPADLATWAEELRSSGRLSTWPPGDWASLMELVDSAQDLVEADQVGRPPRAVLTHSDFNPKNILIDPHSSQVVALLDWEFAHAGSVYTDLGNLTRFERDPELVDSLLAGLAGGPVGAGDHLFRLGRALDLWALVEFAGRSRPNPVQRLATELLLAQVRSGDLQAWPWDTARVDPGRT